MIPLDETQQHPEHNTNSEWVILVDENNNTLGKQEKIKAHELAQCHRAFSIFIYRHQMNNQINNQASNQTTELLLQKRADTKYHCGGLWTNTCCGHPRPGETVMAAAERRLAEETGIQHKQLHFIDRFHYIAKFDNGLTENEVDHVLVGHINQAANGNIKLNPDEASEYCWISPDQLLEAIQAKPTAYTPWLAEALTHVLKHLK